MRAGQEIDPGDAIARGEARGTPILVGPHVRETPLGHIHVGQQGATGLQLTVYSEELCEDARARALLLAGIGRAARFAHPNLLTTLGVTESGGQLIAVRGDPEGATLRNVIHEAMATGRRIEPHRALYWAEQLCGALEALHGTGRGPECAHGYITADTVYLDSTDSVLLGAAGEGAVIPMSPGFGRYYNGGLLPLPPELLGPSPYHSHAADSYAIAALLLEILAGIVVERAGMSLAGVIVPGPPQLVELLQRCIDPDPRARIPSPAHFAKALQQLREYGRAELSAVFALPLDGVSRVAPLPPPGYGPPPGFAHDQDSGLNLIPRGGPAVPPPLPSRFDGGPRGAAPPPPPPPRGAPPPPPIASVPTLIRSSQPAAREPTGPLPALPDFAASSDAPTMLLALSSDGDPEYRRAPAPPMSSASQWAALDRATASLVDGEQVQLEDIGNYDPSYVAPSMSTSGVPSPAASQQMEEMGRRLDSVTDDQLDVVGAITSSSPPAARSGAYGMGGHAPSVGAAAPAASGTSGYSSRGPGSLPFEEPKLEFAVPVGRAAPPEFMRTQAVRTVDASADAGQARSTGASLRGWLALILVLAAVGGGVWYFVLGPGRPMLDDLLNPPPQAQP